MAERQGFEPWIEFPLYTLSKRAPSATRPSLRIEDAGGRMSIVTYAAQQNPGAAPPVTAAVLYSSFFSCCAR
jgi:hypothetical protein